MEAFENTTISRDMLAKQVIRALDNGVKIVGDIAKGDMNGKYVSRLRPTRETIDELYKFADECRKDDEHGE